MLLGDDRNVSKESRHVGNYAKNKIVDEVKFRFWPLNAIRFISNK
jgi:signal peptidase I